jgi:hypothetical protein
MPRLRRRAIDRRQRPQLSLGAWEYLTRRKDYDDLSISQRWDLLLLPVHNPVWRDRILAAVEAGDIEVSADKIHLIGDAAVLDDAITRSGPTAARGREPKRESDGSGRASPEAGNAAPAKSEVEQ